MRIPLHRPAALWRNTYDNTALGCEDLEEHEVIEALALNKDSVEAR
jgi:hypothetical protein